MLIHRANLLLLATAIVISGELYAAGRAPNIVLVLADDLGYGDPGCYNPASKIPTPNIDRLSSEGIRFTDAHTPSAVCTPTRHGLLTGRYAWRTSLKSGVLNGYSPLLIEQGRVTIASFLKRHGYTTAGIGKWHLGLGLDTRTDYSKPLRPGPNSVGFDYFFGIPASLDMPPYVFVENERVLEPPSATIAASETQRKGGAGFWRAGARSPGFKHINVLPTLTEKAVQWIEKQTSARPFFLYLALTAPHTPWLPEPEFESRSGAGPYGDFVVQVDATLGRVLKALDSSGLASNTLLVFTSDNGAHWLPEDISKYGHHSNDNLRGQKADAWDGGHRVPFIARWPGRIRPGSTSAELICLTDMLATVAAILGEKLSKDSGEDSVNILPALVGESLKKPIRDGVVHHSSMGMFAIRQGPWKLILGLGSHGFSEPKVLKPKPGEPAGQLYNMEQDLAESRNLWLERRDMRLRLEALLDQIRK